MIDRKTCTGSRWCVPYCPMGAIVWHKSEKGTKAHSEIDRDECVERGVCRRASVCPADAILEENLQWAREAARIYLTL